MKQMFSVNKICRKVNLSSYETMLKHCKKISKADGTKLNFAN